VRALRARARRVFLDLKLHDIPNTVRGAARSAARLGAELLTVHAMGGRAMVVAAAQGAASGGNTRVIGVTVLTSLDGYALPPGFATPFHTGFVVAQLAQMVGEAGGHGVVCSAAELPFVRQFVGKEIYAVTPGIRSAGAPVHDQARVATIAQAVRAGSSLLVLGRAVTAAPDPAGALERARSERDEAAGQPGASAAPAPAAQP